MRSVHGVKGVDAFLADLRFDLAHPPMTVHRLDRDTTGCLILARTREAQRTLAGYFQDRARVARRGSDRSNPTKRREEPREPRRRPTRVLGAGVRHIDPGVARDDRRAARHHARGRHPQTGRGRQAGGDGLRGHLARVARNLHRGGSRSRVARARAAHGPEAPAEGALRGGAGRGDRGRLQVRVQRREQDGRDRGRLEAFAARRRRAHSTIGRTGGVVGRGSEVRGTGVPLHLHARRVEFTHPSSGGRVRVVAPPPSHMSLACEALGLALDGGDDDGRLLD